MSNPTIPPLALANDHSAVQINNDDTYGLHFEIEAQEDWVYTPEGRFPQYDAQILISIHIGVTDAGALCASQSAADQIIFITRPGQSASSGTYESQNETYSWMVTIIADDHHVIISKTAPLMIDMSSIKTNDVAGDAVITLLPRLKAKHTGPDIDGEPLLYTVEKTSPPIVIFNVVWSPDQPGPGTLTWQVTGQVQECTLRANGEEIGASSYYGNNSQYDANLILEMGTRHVTITAADQNHNTATNRNTFCFPTFSPYFVLQVSNGRPLSLVQSDQTDCLYGVFSKDQDTIICQNTCSGTQDNWQNSGPTLKAGYESSPCVYYHSQFYLLGGSLLDLQGFQNRFWIFQENDWQEMARAPGWTEPRIGQAVALFNQAIWVAGGYGVSGTVYCDVYSYSDVHGWNQHPNLPQTLCSASLAVVGSKLYLFGGYSRGPGGAASTKLYCLSDDGKSWVDQDKKPPDGPTDYWALGSVAGTLLLLASFGGLAFTGHMSSAPDWQGGDANFSSVVTRLGTDTPPFGFTTCEYRHRLFLIIATSEGHSVFAYYELGGNKVEGTA